MIQQERLAKIEEYLKANQTATLTDISNLNEVSVDTVRRDLEILETRGVLKRVRGGAVYRQLDVDVQTFDIRRSEHVELKRELASQLKTLIADGQSVLLNSGTTNIEVAKFLVENYNRLTILTNNIYVLDVLAETKKFTTIVPGGIVDTSENAILGDQCEQDILQYNIDTAVIAVDAISFEKGVTHSHPNQVSVMRAMMKTSRKKVFVADHTKFGRVSCMNVCSIDEMDTIVSDSGFPEELRERFEMQGVIVVTPGHETSFQS